MFMANTILTEQEIRMFIGDTPENNTLVDGVRWSPKDIEQASINVVDYFNLLNPPTGNSYTIGNFPSKALLAIGVAGWLLRGSAIGEASNELEYSAGGVNVGDRNKAQIFATLGGQLWQDFTERAQQMKVSQNIAKIFGSKGSEYRWRSFI